MDNEQIGTSAIINALSKTDFLVPHLQSGDRGLSFDGYIDVFKTAGTNHSKGDLDGQPRVQVKGKKTRPPYKEKISYPVEIEDMGNYLKFGGVIFFVVYFDYNGENETIYYNALLPYDLKRYLREMGNQKTKSISLKRFPTEKEAITEVFVNFVLDMRKQHASIDAEEMTLEAISKRGGLKSLSFSYTSLSKRHYDVLDLLLSKEMFMYADLDYGFKYPVEHISDVVMACASVNRSVLIDNKTNYKKSSSEMTI